MKVEKIPRRGFAAPRDDRGRRVAAPRDDRGTIVRALICVVAFASLASAQANAPAAAPRLTSAQMRDDVGAFRERVLGRDNSYSTAARGQAEAQLRRLEADLDRVTPAQFELALSRIVALADNGHTNVAGSVRARHFNRVGIRLAVFGNELRVIRATEANADLLGARLTAVDGHAIAEVRDSARTLAGGVPLRRDRGAPFLIESPEQLHAFGLAKDAARVTYSVQTLDGRAVQRQLGDEPSRAPDVRNATRLLFPALLPDEQGKWRALLAVNQAPWSLSDPDTPFRWRAAPEIDGMVIELRQTVSSPGNSIESFLTEMTERIQSQRPRNLVMDMRLNGGGNLNTARNFMKSLPGLVPGRIFVLTSPWTFSAAISSIGYLEQTAPDRVTIVGEEVGDRLEFWAEGGPVTLPNSGLVISVATQRHDYQNGCRAFSDCHGPVVTNPIAVPTLAPDVPAPWTIDSYRAGRDPAMEAVAAQLRR
jgi:hypothetical protein